MKYPNSLYKKCLVCLWLWLIIVFYTFPTKTLTAQSFSLEKEFQSDGKFLGVDAIGNLYFLANGVLTKMDTHGKSISYTNRQSGTNLFVDVFDPLNILIFFRDFGNIVFLDNNLTERNKVSPTQLLSNTQPEMACKSIKNGFWAWFPDIFKLVRFDHNLLKQAVSIDMSLNPEIPGKVAYMVENNNRLFMAADNGLWVFDQHANYLFTLSELKIESFQVRNDKIIYRKANNLHVYDFFLDQENVFLLPETHVDHFFLANNKTIYIQTTESLRKYSFSEISF